MGWCIMLCIKQFIKAPKSYRLCLKRTGLFNSLLVRCLTEAVCRMVMEEKASVPSRRAASNIQHKGSTKRNNEWLSFSPSDSPALLPCLGSSLPAAVFPGGGVERSKHGGQGADIDEKNELFHSCPHNLL